MCSGAGEGWAKSILFNDALREQFERFFARPDTFALGVCNGCQMLAALKSMIPGTELWPRFVRNRCEQFEARFSLVRDPALAVGAAAGHGRARSCRSRWRTVRGGRSSSRAPRPRSA